MSIKFPGFIDRAVELVHLAHAGEIMYRFAPNLIPAAVGPYMTNSVLAGIAALAVGWTVREICDTKPKTADIETADAGDLKKKLDDLAIQLPRDYIVNGTFFPGILLFRGWWERDKARIDADIPWIDPPMQRWLFRGFNEWAPSWDITGSELPATSGIQMIGQIGTDDEADSIPVIVKRANPWARLFADDIQGRLVTKISLRGTLCREDDLIAASRRLSPDDIVLLKSRGILGREKTPFFIVVGEDDGHYIRKTSDHVEYYSGYLWQALAPRGLVPQTQPELTDIGSSYFAWEHTNFADRDVIRYNMDSFKRKRAFIQKHVHGAQKKRDKKEAKFDADLVMLQHLMDERRLGVDSREPETPRIGMEYFLRALEASQTKRS